MLQKGVKLQVSYPYLRDPHCLPNDRHAFIRMAEKQEKRLINKEF
jgi:hypothetical protein